MNNVTNETHHTIFKFTISFRIWDGIGKLRRQFLTYRMIGLIQTESEQIYK